MKPKIDAFLEPRYSMAACLLGSAMGQPWSRALESITKAKKEADLNAPFNHTILCGLPWYEWLHMAEAALEHGPYLEAERRKLETALYHFLGAEAEVMADA